MRQKLLAASYGENTNGKRPPGRPRSEKARQAILRSMLKVLGKNGFADLTIEEVADRAAVGKATVYRWWPNKGALIADAFAISTTRHLHFPDTGSVYTDMSRQMRQLVKVFRRREAYATLERAIRRGELRKNVDPDLLLDSLYGPIYMRFLIQHDRLTRDFVDHLCALVLDGARPRKK